MLAGRGHRFSRALLRHGQTARDVDKHGRRFGFGALRLLVLLGLEKRRRGFRAARRLVSAQLVPDALLRVLLLVPVPGGGGDPLRRRRRQPGGLQPGGLPPRLPAQPRAGSSAQGHQGADVRPAPEEGQREGEAADEDPGRRAPHAAQLPAPHLQPEGTAPHKNTNPEVHHQVHRRTDGAPRQRREGVEPTRGTRPGMLRVFTKKKKKQKPAKFLPCRSPVARGVRGGRSARATVVHRTRRWKVM